LFELGGKLIEMFDIIENGIVALIPKFQVADDTSDHGCLSVLGAREVYFYVIFKDIGVDPRKNFSLRVKENHVLIDYEVSVVVGESTAGIDDGSGAEVSPIGIVELFQLRNVLVL
jgi:hypothetical protein